LEFPIKSQKKDSKTEVEMVMLRVGHPCKGNFHCGKKGLAKGEGGRYPLAGKEVSDSGRGGVGPGGLNSTGRKN